MNHSDVIVGDIYAFSAKGRTVVAQVIKRNPKNMKMRDSLGVQWTVHPSYLREATGTQIDQFKTTTAKPVAGLGSLVKYKGMSRAGILGEFDTFVVIAVKDATFNITPLGGAGNRYMRGISPSDLEVIHFNVEEMV